MLSYSEQNSLSCCIKPPSILQYEVYYHKNSHYKLFHFFLSYNLFLLANSFIYLWLRWDYHLKIVLWMNRWKSLCILYYVSLFRMQTFRLMQFLFRNNSVFSFEYFQITFCCRNVDLLVETIRFDILKNVVFLHKYL